MRYLFSILMSGRKAFSRSNRGWWAGVTEALLAAGLLLAGIIVLAVSITFAVLFSTPEGLYTSVWFFSLQIVGAVALIVIGTYCVLQIFWKVGVSAERRDAIVSQAGDIELLNELRSRRDDLPQVPTEKYVPQHGLNLLYKLTPSRRTVWGFATSAVLAALFVVLATTLIINVVKEYRQDGLDWVATGFAIPVSFAALWSVYSFLRQLMKLTGIGPTTLEISNYPIVPGGDYEIFLSQPGRLRLKLVDVFLICREQATFDDGTDIRTEKRVVYQQRLFRKRGVQMRRGQPFEVNFEMSLPRHAMHSFHSRNNRVIWELLVHVKVKGWPQIERRFTISVLPMAAAA